MMLFGENRDARTWWILLWDDGISVLPQAEAFTDPGAAEREQRRRPGSRLRKEVR